jgi:hypothetical protein
VDAGTGVEGGVAAHAAVDRVPGGPQPAAAVTGPVGSAVSLARYGSLIPSEGAENASAVAKGL